MSADATPPGLPVAPTETVWTGEAIDNAPGQAQIAFRIADYVGFTAEMLKRLPKQAVLDPDAPGGVGYPLKDVHLDEAAAWIPALVKSWAQVGDILTFYQERIANEGYIQTALEPVSIDALHAEVGIRRGAPPAPSDSDAAEPLDQAVYRIDPGVAASTMIAFTVVQAPNGPIAVPVPAGSAIRSHSTNAGSTQTFETSEDFTARLVWNSMSAALTPAPPPPDFAEDAMAVTLAGAQTGLKPGGRLLIVGAPATGGAVGWASRTIATVEPNKTLGVTLVTFEPGGAGEGYPIAAPQVFAFTRRARLFGYDATPFPDEPLKVQLANPDQLLGGVDLFTIDLMSTEETVSLTESRGASMNAGFPTSTVRDVAFEANGDVRLGASDGVYGWSQQTWTSLSQGMTSKDVHTLSQSAEGFLYAGTGGGGAFRTANAQNGWDVLPSGVYLNVSQPIKASLPRATVLDLVAADILVGDTTGFPIAVARTNQGVSVNLLNGDGWCDTGWDLRALPPDLARSSKSKADSLSVQPLVTAMTAGKAMVFAAADGAVRGAYLEPIVPGGTASGGTETPYQTGIWIYVEGTVTDLVACDIFEWFELELMISAVDPPSLTYARIAVIDFPLPHFVQRNVPGLAPSDTGVMLALCAGGDGGQWYAPRFYGIWSTGGKSPEIALYACIREVRNNVVRWVKLLDLASGKRLALPPAYGLATRDDSLAMLSPLVAMPTWKDFQSKAGSVDLVASGFSLTPGSWLMLERPATSTKPSLVNAWPVASSLAGQREDYGVSGKILTVELEGDGLAGPDASSDKFDLVETVAYAASGALPLAGPSAPSPQSVSGDQLDLVGMIDLPSRQPLAITGQRLRLRIGRFGGVWESPDARTLADGCRLANADVLCMAINEDGDRIAVGAQEGVLVLENRGGGFAPMPPTPNAPNAKMTALETCGKAFVGLAGTVIHALTSDADDWTVWSVPGAAAALTRNVHGEAVVATIDGAIGKLSAAGFAAIDCDPLPGGATALCVTGDGEVFAAVASKLLRLPPGEGKRAWVNVGKGLEVEKLTVLYAPPGGAAMAAFDGAGVFVWSGSAWKHAFTAMPVSRVRSLRAGKAGTMLVGGYGEGAYVGDGATWTALGVGLSNTVSCFAVHEASVFAGLRAKAILTPPAPAPLIELDYDVFPSLPDPDGALGASLDQSLVTQALRRTFQGAAQTLSEAARVVAVRRDGWVICDGADNLFLLGRRAGSISLGTSPDPLVAASPISALTDGLQGCVVEMADGVQVPAMTRPGDLIRRPARASDPQLTEVASVASSVWSPDRATTSVTLAAPLANLFDASTLTVNANLVAATQGQTVQEILGSGNAMLALQQFKISQPPLTFVAAPPPANVRSTLVVLVNGAPWREIGALRSAGPGDQVYTVDITPDGGATITFGDGLHGARLPTGTSNVAAVYRSGMGPVGDTDAGMLSIMLQPPAGIAKVTNPVAITPGRNAETQEAVLQRAPGRLRAAGRLISLDDFAAFIAGSAGVAQATSLEMDAGGIRTLQITIVGKGPQPLAQDDPLVSYLQGQIAARSAVPPPPVTLLAASVVTFNLTAGLWFTPGVDRGETIAAATAAVEDAFSASARALAQDVHAGEIVRVLQAVQGVAGVQIAELYRTGDQTSSAATLKAWPAQWNARALKIEPAELLVVALDGLALADAEAPS